MSPVREENLILCNAPLVGGAMDVSADQVKSIVDAAADAGGDGSGGEDSGCGCSSSPTSRSGWALWAAVGLALYVRRRRS